MARWDEILSLPVQSPSTLEFCASDLVWSKVEGWRDKLDRVALIPFARVDDFVRGESSNKDCPTRFHVEARRRRRLKAPYKVKVDGILEYILYWCSFGPDDHRKGGVVRPSRNTYIPKKKSAGRPNTKRGCTCHFIVKRLIAEPSVALVIYNQDKHVDKSGLPCHGPQDKKAAGTHAMYAPYISEDLRLRVYSLLYVGVSVETIMQRHNESVEKQGGPCNRDDLLTHRYVRRQERSIRRSKYELDDDDSVSISMWVENHPTSVFFYEDFSESCPFTIGIQTEWQLQQMIQFGKSLMASDSRFGTNKFKYPVHSLLVFNSENKAIPVAWVISPRFSSGDAYRWMRALYNRVLTKDPTWKLAGFIVDDPLADISAIRDVFECSVLISVWRVRHAWHKNLMKKCTQNEVRLQMSKRLGEAMSEICTGQGTVKLFDEFMKDFVDNSEFVEYFKAVWYPKIGSWIGGLQTLPLSSLESSSAIEYYHRQMHVRVLNETDSYVYHRVDWLTDKLVTKVHSFFWLDEYPGKHDFTRYWKDEWVNGCTSFQSSLKIPDSDVSLEDQCAKVIDQEDPDKFHLVFNLGSEFSICDCLQSERGFLCEHVFKAKQFYRKKGSGKPSLSLSQYKKVLIKMLHCPPHDSLIRDHAVSLAAFLHTQINALTTLGSDRSTTNEIGPHSGSLLSAEEHRDAVEQTQIHSANECVSSGNENDIEPDNKSQDQEVIEKHPCDESVLHEEMDMDPSSICASPSGLFAVHGVLPADILSMNGNEMPRDDYGNQNEHEHESSGQGSHEQIVDADPQSIDIPLSMDSNDPCSVMNQHDDNTDTIVAFVGPVNSAADKIDPDLDRSSVPSSEAELPPAKKRKIPSIDDDDDRREDSKNDVRRVVESPRSANDPALRNKHGGSAAEEKGIDEFNDYNNESASETAKQPTGLDAVGSLIAKPCDAETQVMVQGD